MRVTMECTAIRDWLFRKIDGELSDHENRELNAHLAQCSACTREYNLLALPHRIAQEIPAVSPSEYFYRRLSMSIASEAGSSAFWLAILRPARRIVPALACITFILLTVFAYFQMRSPSADLYTAYERVFILEDQPRQMLTKGDVTDERILNEIFARENKNSSSEMK
jgi:predicted anti-sigma-YlaC factor YlaD